MIFVALLLLACDYDGSALVVAARDGVASDRPAVEARAAGLARRIDGGALPGAEGAYRADLDAAVRHLAQADACVEAFAAADLARTLRESEVHGWHARCLRLAAMGRESVAALEGRFDRAQADWEGADAVLAELAGVAASVEAALAPLPAHPRRVALTVKLGELSSAVEAARTARVGGDAGAFLDALVRARSARADVERDVADSAAVARHVEEVVVALRRTSTFWGRFSERVGSGDDVEWKSRGWRELTAVEQTSWERSPRQGDLWAHDTKVRSATTATVRTEVDGVAGEPREVQLDEAQAAAVVEVWKMEQPGRAHVAHRVESPPADSRGVPSTLTIEGRLVLRDKPVGAWPDESVVVVPGVSP